MDKKLFLPVLLLFMSVQAFAQRSNDNGMMYLDENRRPVYRENIVLPEVNGYQLLKCDFHQHTVFSDGHVWPNVRNQEAWEEGLDAFALTDHIEYHPHKDDVTTDHNRSYEVGKEGAAKNNVLFIKGSEITRNTPPGHFNAIFLKDSSPFTEEKNSEFDRKSIMMAKEQGAFIFWNHPGWKPNIEGSYEWLPFIDDVYRNKALHGIEVINGFGFHMKALDWCIDKGLTVMGTSDIHNLIAHDYDRSKSYVHRTMTLVMAKERSSRGIREALDAGRTIAWSSKLLAGREDLMHDLFHACVKVAPSHYSQTNTKGVTTKFYEITNSSDLYFELQLKNGKATKRIVLYPQSKQLISAQAEQSAISYDVVTTYVRSNKHLNVMFNLK